MRKEAGLPLYKYIGAYRDHLPVYASGNFHGTVQEYVDEALYYKEKESADTKRILRALWNLISRSIRRYAMPSDPIMF